MTAKWLFLGLIVFLPSCKAKQESMAKHAKITSELQTYQEDDFFKENYNDTLFTDYLNLSYEQYQDKYDLKRREMDLMAASAEVTISILETNRALVEYQNLMEKMQKIQRLDTTFLDGKYARTNSILQKYFYQFDSIDTLPPGFVPIEKFIVPVDTLK